MCHLVSFDSNPGKVKLTGTKKRTVGRPMQFGDISSGIPLLLSYPTVILAGHLVLTPSMEGSDVRLVLLPLFAASVVSCLGVGCRLWSGLRSVVCVSVLVFLFSQLSSVLGTIQTTTLSLLTVKLVLSQDRQLSWAHLLRIYTPLCVLSVIIAKDSGMGGPLAAYAALLASLKWVLPAVPEREVSLKGKLAWLPPVASFAVLNAVCYFKSLYVQFLMAFVFVGCLAILLLSAKDMILDNNAQNAVSVPRYFVVACGLMAIVLQFLSFNSISSSKFLDALTLLYTFSSEYVSWSIQSDSCSSSHAPASEHSGSLLEQIAKNKDTRSIFSFLLLNTTFMFVQLLYSFRSKSLGLLSDSLHMALDCTSLLLGLIAGVLAKKPPSDKFPFALGFLETLAGFTNGILLLGIVCGIFVESLGRLMNPVHLHKTNELLVVATLGLIVNLAGLFAFDHGGHSHGSGNENMRGIFLHILADTLGSVGVIVSTILIKLTHMHIFDPLASLFIGTLILLSAIPLLKSTTSSILLKLDDKGHNMVKNALNQISTTPGITGYTTPRFWPASIEPSGHTHGHSHGHSHSVSHSDDHLHDHSHNHSHEHSHEHSHDCSHNHPNEVTKKAHLLVGYIHVQYTDGENSTIIKKRVEKIFETIGIKAWIQVEPQDSPCWCRTSSQNMIP